jgi:hypothetical protein
MAAACPSCGRPLALARPACLYCGAALPAAVVQEAARLAQAAQAAAPMEPALAGPPRSLLVVDLAGADVQAVAGALAVSAFEAAQRARRPGWQLHRIVAAEDAAGEAERMGRAGIRVRVLPETEVRAASRPLPVVGGSLADDGLHLRAGAGPPVTARAQDLLLVVRGPITREYLPAARFRRVRTATLEPGHRFHLHRRDDPRPLELDPASFDFGPTLAESSLLLLSSWIETAAAGVPVDDGFRREAPALAPAAPAADGVAAALGSAGQRRGQDEPQVLDNLEQFRFYSAWHACVLRSAR